MSRYNDDGYDDPRRYHTVNTRRRDPGEPDYVREETYIERGKGPGPRDLVYRGREDSIEDIDREFPPPNSRDYRGYDDRGPRRAKSVRGSRYDDNYDDYYDDRDRYTDYGAAGAGAAAGYAAGRRGEGERRRRRRRDHSRDHSDYSDDSRRRSPERRKSGVGEVLGGLGLGGLAAGLLGKDKDKRDDDRSVRSRSRPGTSRASRSYRSEGERSRSRDRRGDDKKKWTQAAQAAIIAGAVEAFRSRKEPGAWSGEKGKRIATAAIGAGGIDRLIDRNPDEKSKRHLAEAVVGGLVANRLANGSARSKSRTRDRAGSPDTAFSRRSRSRSVIDRFRGRSASRGPDGELKQGGGGNGIKELVAGGALAAAGKAIYDRVRSKSRNRRSRSRSSSRDSFRSRRRYSPDDSSRYRSRSRDTRY